MKVHIDPDMCQGHARCFQLAPQVFALDHEGHGYVIAENVAPENQPAALNAVANCPERAITTD